MADHRLEPQAKRPLGVTIVAVYYFLGAALFLMMLVAGVLGLAGGSGFFSGDLGEEAQHAQTYFGVFVLLILIFAAIGLGIWSLQPLARRVVLFIPAFTLPCKPSSSRGPPRPSPRSRPLSLGLFSFGSRLP